MLKLLHLFKKLKFEMLSFEAVACNDINSLKCKEICDFFLESSI